MVSIGVSVGVALGVGVGVSVGAAAGDSIGGSVGVGLGDGVEVGVAISKKVDAKSSWSGSKLVAAEKIFPKLFSQSEKNDPVIDTKTIAAPKIGIAIAAFGKTKLFFCGSKLIACPERSRRVLCFRFFTAFFN